jgi:hypothetical protein
MLDSSGGEPASVGDRNAAGIDQDNVNVREPHQDEPVKRIVPQLEGDGNEAS